TVKSSVQGLAMEPSAAPPVLIVSLEQDLLPNGLRIESVLAAIGGRPARAPALLAAAATGRLNQALLREGDMDFTTLPWRQDAVDALRLRRAEGVRLVLRARCGEELAQRAVAHLGLFDDVLGDGQDGPVPQGHVQRLPT